MTEDKEITVEQQVVENGALQSDKMRNTKIGKLLLTMSLPAIFSMLVQAMYNIVDSIFLTGINYILLLSAAPSQAAPVQCYFCRIGLLCGGFNAVFAKVRYTHPGRYLHRRV